MSFLLAIEQKKNIAQETRFPFGVAAIRSTPRLEFASPVTFFVGENGSGKSTLLESIAAGANAIAVGGNDVAHDETLSAARELAEIYRFSWKRKNGNFGRRILQTTRELDELISGYETELELSPRDAGLPLAIGFMKGQKAALVSRYGENLDACSHGESFMKVFESRLKPGGLYLLDEPEAALSPLRQLAFLKMMKEFAAQDCQFIIATHSPILMAFPEAQIFSFDKAPIARVNYDELEHVKITRAFLRDPESFLRRL